jgi:predicted acetyltransferase
VCYALEFAAGGGKRLPGLGIGAVGTRQAFRKRGLASRLCEHAAARSAADGRHIGLLFSAIPPGLYERLGYRAVPASDLGSEDLEALAASGKAAELVAFDPLDALDELAASYERSHTGLHLHRDPAAWERSLGNNASDLFLTAGSPDEQYVRLYKGDENLEIVECAGGDTAAVVRAVAAMALRLGRKRVDTWLELDGDVARHFTDRGRAATLPMVKGHVELDGAGFSSADYF